MSTRERRIARQVHSERMKRAVPRHDISRDPIMLEAGRV